MQLREILETADISAREIAMVCELQRSVDEVLADSNYIWQKDRRYNIFSVIGKLNNAKYNYFNKLSTTIVYLI